MSDFLSRLAERALGATPPLQPLLGSRFAAPAAEPADGFAEETVEGEFSASPAPAVRRSEASPPPPPRPLSAAPADVRDADPAPSTLLMPAPPPEAPAAASSSQDPIESPAPVAGDAPAPRSAPRVESIPPSPGAVPDRGAAGEHRERRERREDRALLIPVVTRSDPPVPSPSAAGVEDGDARPSGVGAARRVEAAPRGPTEVVIRTVQDERDPFGEEDDSGALLMPVARDRQTVVIGGDVIGGDAIGGGADGAEPRHQRPPERVPAAGMEKGGAERPVVQVTIGRIEVRAVHPPAPPQPAREAGWTPPVLSLDDYLKRGSGR